LRWTARAQLRSGSRRMTGTPRQTADRMEQLRQRDPQRLASAEINRRENELNRTLTDEERGKIEAGHAVGQRYAPYASD
jgi:hypothetical protein